jgi:hypothetical protein
MSLNADEVAFLRALADATDAAKAAGGTKQLFRPGDLVMEGYLSSDVSPGALSNIAARLHRRHLVIRKVIYGVVRYAITDAARREERAHRATDAAELALVGAWSEASRELGAARAAFEQAREALEDRQLHYEASRRALDAYYELVPAGAEG